MRRARWKVTGGWSSYSGRPQGLHRREPVFPKSRSCRDRLPAITRNVRVGQGVIARIDWHRTYDLGIELANLEVLLIRAPKVGEVAHFRVLAQRMAALRIGRGIKSRSSSKRNKQWTRLGSALRSMIAGEKSAIHSEEVERVG